MPTEIESRLAIIEAHKRREPYNASLLADGEPLIWLTIPEWSPLYPRCWVCGWREGEFNSDGKIALQVHHIERRSQSYKPHQNWTVNLFKACNVCHEGPLATMRHAAQLAYKWAYDNCGLPTLDDLVWCWLQVKDPELKAPRRVTADDVLEEFDRIGLVISR